MMHATDFGYFSVITVSQGSVATCLRCYGIFTNNNFIANLLLSLSVKQFLPRDAAMLARS